MFTHTLFRYKELPLLFLFILVIKTYDTTKWNHICHSSFEYEEKNYTFVFNEDMLISCVNDSCNIEQSYNKNIMIYYSDIDMYNTLKDNAICFTDNYLRIPYCIVLTTLISLMLSR